MTTHLIDLTRRESKLRLIAFILASFVASSPAAAQGWKEYSYADYAFSVAFPVTPKIEAAAYQISDGHTVDARVYSVTQEHAVFKMTIADMSGSAIEESALIDYAVKTLSNGREIKLDIRHRVRAVFGRQLSIAGADGSYSFVALFYHDKRLYQVEGTALAAGSDARAEAMRFQQSLDFTDNASYRPARPR
jgi:hypothetical protein